jgi:multidrug resistance efflux pump
VVAVIYPKRYELMVLRTEERLKGLEVALRRAEEEAKIKEELFALSATTRQEVARTRAEAEIARFRVAEAASELDINRFDLSSCKIKAPFSGHFAVRYKQPDESVERGEKVFAIVDSAKVYAVANVPEMPAMGRSASRGQK